MTDKKGKKSVTEKLREFDSLRTMLKNSKNPKGQDLYTHLVEVVNHLVMHCPDTALDKFEEVSFLLKNKDSIDMKEFLNVEEDRPYSRYSEDIADLTKDFLNKAKKYFDVSFTLLTEQERGSKPRRRRRSSRRRRSYSHRLCPRPLGRLQNLRMGRHWLR